MPKANASYISGLVSDYRAKSQNTSGIVDVITFAEAPWGLSFCGDQPLLPMQKFILKVFYGMRLDGTKKYIPLPDIFNSKVFGYFTEEEMMDYMIKNRIVNLKSYEPGKHRKVLILCCGRRGSKSTIISIVSCYEAYRLIKMGNPQEHFGFPAGNEIDITTVASVEDQADTLFGMIKNRVTSSSFFKGRMDSDTKSCFSIMTDDDIRVGRDASVRIYCGGAGSSKLRSKNNLVVIMDEAAHFESVGKASLAKAWQDLTPSTATFVPRGGDREHGEGKVIMLSSPLSKSGLFYQKVCESYEYPDETLMFKMSTAMMNPTVESGFLKSEYRSDRGKFMCEYGGEFSDSISGWAEPAALEKAVDQSRACNLPRGEAGASYYMGLDYGGRNDGTSVAICHREDEAIVLDYADVYYSANSDVWESPAGHYKDVNRLFADEEVIPMNRFADEVKSLCDRFNIVSGWFDQFNGYGLMELLRERGLRQFEMKSVTMALNAQVYQTAKSLINTGMLRLFAHPVLVPELSTLEEKREGASLKVEAPQRAGYHDDISDAFSRAVWAAYNSRRSSVKNVTLGAANGRGGMGLGGARTYRSYHREKLLAHGGISPRAWRMGF